MNDLRQTAMPPDRLPRRPRPARGAVPHVGRAGLISLGGVVIGWMAMMSMVSLVLLGWALISSPGELEGSVGVLGVFGVCSLVVCAGAWLLVGWPLTWVFWDRLAGQPGGWWRHALRGGAGGLGVGLLPLVFGAPAGGVAWFAGLAIVAGAAAGGWTGWKVRQARLKREFQQGWKGGGQ